MHMSFWTDWLQRSGIFTWKIHCQGELREVCRWTKSFHSFLQYRIKRTLNYINQYHDWVFTQLKVKLRNSAMVFCTCCKYKGGKKKLKLIKIFPKESSLFLFLLEILKRIMVCRLSICFLLYQSAKHFSYCDGFLFSPTHWSLPFTLNEKLIFKGENGFKVRFY